MLCSAPGPSTSLSGSSSYGSSSKGTRSLSTVSLRGARQHKHTHQIMNENNMDHSMESWEEDQFNNAGGRRRRSLSGFDVEERRVIVRVRGSMEGPQMRFSVLVPLVSDDFLHNKQRS